MNAVSAAREVSFLALSKVQNGGYASDLLRLHTAPLEARDASLAESIVMGCLRYQGQLDFLVAHYSGRPLQKLDEAVLIALRMGIFQLRYLDRVPAHAAVTESVELVKQARKRSAAGFVNAVLRKVNRQPVRWPDRATELSIPAWMLTRWENFYGKEAAEGIAKAALNEPGIWINPETGRQQDIGAQAIVPLLEIEPSTTVLDLCAAPGNKTAQIVAQGANTVACDRYLKRLQEVTAAALQVALDATEPLPFSRRFDRILIDAPCSGTGTLDRNPEIKWRLQPADLSEFQARQKKILRNALDVLKPGGVLVYATCSLEPEENQEVVAGLAASKTLLRLPGRDPGDGFFAAVLRS